MLAELSEFLNQSVTPERNAVFINTVEVLESIGFETHRDEITSYISSSAAQDPTDIVDTVDGILRTAVRSALSDFGITLTDDFELDVATDMIVATGELDNYEDHTAVLNACAVDDTPESIMADLMELLGRFDSSRYITNIEMVTSSLVERIEAFHRKDDPIEEASVEELRARSRTVAYLAMMHDDTDYMVERYITEGLAFGLPFSEYTNRFEQIDDDWKVSRLGCEILALVLASDLPDDQLDRAAAAFVEEYTRNIERAAQTISVYNKIKAEVFHA